MSEEMNLYERCKNIFKAHGVDMGGGYEPPVGGIPKTDLASDVQENLEKADSALQPSDTEEAETIEIDDEVTVDSSNLITSGAVAAYVTEVLGAIENGNY